MRPFSARCNGRGLESRGRTPCHPPVMVVAVAASAHGGGSASCFCTLCVFECVAWMRFRGRALVISHLSGCSMRRSLGPSLVGSVHRECVRSAFASVQLFNRSVRSGVSAHSLVRRSLIGASFLLGLHLRRVSLGRASHCSVCCGVSLGLVSNAGRLVGVRLCACSFLGVCVCVSHLPFVAGYLVDPASSHMLVSKIKPCMSKYKRLVL